MITDRDIEVLRAVARYYVVSRHHVQRLCFPGDRTGRATRRRLQALVSARLLNRAGVELTTPSGGSPGPLYYPARSGLELLAEHFDDESILGVCCRSPQQILMHHWLAVTETHITMDAAIDGQGRTGETAASAQRVHLDGWINEFDVLNPAERAPEQRFRLYTLIREHPRLVCVPDAAFLLTVGEHRKVFYLEQDRATSGVRQVAARKTPGYAAMAQFNLHRRHFPETNVEQFAVLCIAPSDRRRDALRKAIAGKPGCDHWRFASVGDLTAETMLFEPVFRRCDGQAAALVKREAVASGVAPAQAKPGSAVASAR